MGLLNGEPIEALEPFAQKYGIHGWVLKYETGEALEVRTLDFMLHDYIQQCEAIPEEERLEYKRLLLSTPEIMRVSFNGGCYHSAVGERWLSKDDEDYGRVTALPYTGRP